MSGLIGTALKNYLSDKHHLSALNRSHVDGVQCYQADITDLNSILPAFENKDTVVQTFEKYNIVELKCNSQKSISLLSNNFPFERTRFSKYSRGIEFTRLNYCNDL